MAAALAQLEAAEGGYLSEGEALQATKEELLRMKRLVEALLVLAREGRVTPVPLDLAALAREEARAFGVPYRGPETLPTRATPSSSPRPCGTSSETRSSTGREREWRCGFPRRGRTSSWR